MNPPSPRVVAQFVAEDYFAKHNPNADADARMALVTRIETALRAAILEEREACAGVCDGRSELWQRGEGNLEKPAPFRAEARARSVEAAYLSDAIRART